MSTGGPLESYLHIQPSDYGQFYAIEPWKESPSWLAEPWSADHRGFVEDAIAGQVRAKWTPPHVSDRLDRLAAETQQHLDNAARKIGFEHAEFRSTHRDFSVLAGLARYHAAKSRAATEIAFYHRTGQTKRLSLALKQIQAAEEAWREIVEATEDVYHPNLVFGYSAERSPPIAGAIRAHTGHWKDRLPEVRADVDWVRKLLTNANAPADPILRYPGEISPSPESLPKISHQPALEAVSGADLEIRATVTSETELRGVFLHHRPMDQTQDWKSIRMKPQGAGEFFATIPGNTISSLHDHLYYIEALVEGGGRLWPEWLKEAPYRVVSTR